MAALRKLLDPARMGPDAERLSASLRRKIVGQDAALRQIVEAYQTFQAGMSAPGRPVCNFLFLGPTGSGKTRTVEALAESLVGDARAAIRIDCGEYQHGHEISKLIGSPPGYLGHRETHALLSQEALDQFHTETVPLSFVLFDEIEKSSDTLWNLLLGVLDKASLTLGDNRRVDFSHAMIFLTGNLGAAAMEAIERPAFGFGVHARAPEERLAGAATEAARKRFSPEFLNRIDRTVVFRPLGNADLERILGLEIELARGRIALGAPGIECRITRDARALLLEEGTDPRYGARHLKRAIERLLVQPVSNLIASKQLQRGDRLVVEPDTELRRLVFAKEMRAAAGSVAA